MVQQRPQQVYQQPQVVYQQPQVVYQQPPQSVYQQQPQVAYQQPLHAYQQPPLGVVHEGWVTKRAVSAPGWLKNWRRRHVRLLANRLEWRKALDEPPAGFLPIDPTTSVALSPSRALNIEVKHGSTVLLFECSTDALCSAWMSALGEAIRARATAAAPGGLAPGLPPPPGAPPMPYSAPVEQQQMASEQQQLQQVVMAQPLAAPDAEASYGQPPPPPQATLYPSLG